MHYGDANPSNGFVFTDARLTKSATVIVPEETTEASTEETTEETTEATTEEETTVEETTIEVGGGTISMIILDGDDAGDSSMMGDYSDKTGTGYKYLGFATTKDATDDYKYLVIEYIGDVRFLRLEADGSGKAIWFDPAQADHIVPLAIVNEDGELLDELPLETDEPISIIIDLEASGFPATGSYIGYHMHYLDPAVESNGFAVLAAALITDIPEEGDEIETVAPTTEAASTEAESTAAAAGNTNPPATGDVTPVAVVMMVCLLSVVVLGGTLVVRKRNF
jgi:hypothetical protein